MPPLFPLFRPKLSSILLEPNKNFWLASKPLFSIAVLSIPPKNFIPALRGANAVSPADLNILASAPPLEDDELLLLVFEAGFCWVDEVFCVVLLVDELELLLELVEFSSWALPYLYLPYFPLPKRERIECLPCAPTPFTPVLVPLLVSWPDQSISQWSPSLLTHAPILCICCTSWSFIPTKSVFQPVWWLHLPSACTHFSAPPVIISFSPWRCL